MGPVCGRGPWKSPLNHVALKHGIDKFTMRDICGLKVKESVARAGKNRARWLRDVVNAALGEPLNYPHDAFVDTQHEPSSEDSTGLALVMGAGKYGIRQLGPAAGSGRDTVSVPLNFDGGEAPTGPEVRELLGELAPWIERVILDCEARDGVLTLGEDAHRALAHVRDAIGARPLAPTA